MEYKRTIILAGKTEARSWLAVAVWTGKPVVWTDGRLHPLAVFTCCCCVSGTDVCTLTSVYLSVITWRYKRRLSTYTWHVYRASLRLRSHFVNTQEWKITGVFMKMTFLRKCLCGWLWEPWFQRDGAALVPSNLRSSMTDRDDDGRLTDWPNSINFIISLSREATSEFPSIATVLVNGKPVFEGCCAVHRD